MAPSQLVTCTLHSEWAKHTTLEDAFKWRAFNAFDDLSQHKKTRVAVRPLCTGIEVETLYMVANDLRSGARKFPASPALEQLRTC